MLFAFRTVIAVILLLIANFVRAGDILNKPRTILPSQPRKQYNLYNSFSLFYLSHPFTKDDSSSVEIPFIRAGNLILIQAKADTLDGNFILDTGAPKLVLNTTYFREYPSISDHSSNEESGGITG